MLSIIVPIFNGQIYLKKFIENIQSQSFENFELILVNDGSIDETETICEKYEKRDSRIVVINKKNEGSGPARNDGLRIAKGKYIMFVDCDDYFEKNYLEILYNTISENKVDLVICGQTDVINSKKIIYKKIVPQYREYTNKEDIRLDYIKLKKIGIADVLWNKIYSNKIIKDNKLMFPDLRRGQDAVFNITYFDKINSCITVEKALYYYRKNSLSNIFDKFPKNHYEIICKENMSIEKQIQKWGVYDKYSKEYLDIHFMRAVFSALTNAFNPKWNFNFISKYNYIKNIISKTKVKYGCHIYEQYSLYEKLIIILIKKNLVLFLMIVLEIKILKKKLICFNDLIQRYKIIS